MPKKGCNLFLYYDKDELEMFTGKTYAIDAYGCTVYENGIALTLPQECGENDVKCNICKAEEVYSILEQKCPTFKDYISKYGKLNAEIDTWFSGIDGEVNFIAMWHVVEMEG